MLDQEKTLQVIDCDDFEDADYYYNYNWDLISWLHEIGLLLVYFLSSFGMRGGRREIICSLNIMERVKI